MHIIFTISTFSQLYSSIENKSLFLSTDNGVMKITQFWDKTTLFFPNVPAPVPVE